MRTMILAGLACVAAGAAWAQSLNVDALRGLLSPPPHPAIAGECPAGRSDIIRLDEWSAEPGDARTVALTIRFTNVSDRSFRMVDGGVSFADVLGRSLGGVALPEDTALAPRQSEVREFNMLAAGGMERLPSVSPSDVRAISCVRAVVYDDGTVERFD